MSRETPMSPSQMRELGWERVDPRPWSKLRARWLHASGWTLAHCGHPTAIHPWVLTSPEGRMVLTGVTLGNPPTFGTAWNSIREAAEWLATHLAGEPMPPELRRGDVVRTRDGRTGKIRHVPEELGPEALITVDLSPRHGAAFALRELTIVRRRRCA